MADLVFSGPYRDPVVIEVPGLVPPITTLPWRVFWGEDLNFTFPDPGAGDYKLVLKASVDDCEPIHVEEVTHPGSVALVIEMIGGDVRKKFIPGIYFFSLLLVGASGSGYLEKARGGFHILEGGSSLEVPASE